MSNKKDFVPFDGLPEGIRIELFEMLRADLVHGRKSVEDFAKEYQIPLGVAQMIVDDWKRLHKDLQKLHKDSFHLAMLKNTKNI